MGAGDFVDLTTSPDEAPPPRKRARSPAPDVDLAAADEEEEARRRIMAHARRMNQERGMAGAADALAAGGSGGGGGSGGPPAAAPPPAPVAAEPLVTPGANALLAQLHAERMARQVARQQQQQQESAGICVPVQQLGALQLHGSQQRRQQQQAQPRQPQQQQQATPRQAQGEARLTLLTWNVWFREDIHVEARMAAIGGVIAARRPTFVCLQEVTPHIYHLFQRSPWWPAYYASNCPAGAPYFTTLLALRDAVQGAAGSFAEIPYENSIMGRDLKTVAGKVGGHSVRVATTHLESPTGWQPDQQHRQQRQAQLQHAAVLLELAREDDVLLAGDMNWGPDDGQPPLPGGWCDAWLHLHGGAGEQEGMTYDNRQNAMLHKKGGRALRRRLDRVFCRLRCWRLAGLELVGRQPLPGLQFEGRPVLPSDHFGLLLELHPSSKAGGPQLAQAAGLPTVFVEKAARLKMGGNPFAKEGKQDLLAGGSDALRSDDPDWQNQNEEQEPARSAALPAGELAEAAGALEGAPGAAQAPEQLQQQRGAAPVAAYGAQLPPPPPLVPAPLPPGAVSGTLYGDGSSADGRPYYPSAPGASGAWGSGSYEAAAAAAPPQPGFPPTAPGYPLPAAGSMGMYGISSDYQYGAGAPPQAAPAWTNSYPTDQQLAYTLALEQAGGAPPRQKLACGGLGEQWSLFLIGIFLWPLWYVACVWYCASKKQQADPRYRTPFILNCVASTVFTVIWVAVVVRNTGTWMSDCGTDAGGNWYCW
ncbi:Endonuclease exonuclease phosphatase family isoform B [Micractinium conductrix]|uniref:Endonuclease exonuclease phosphatase family isoform B n=1 Tax=Micractinium conductrix TaxID=554055 RepID=A0A2P6VMM1_9CHLO|nr:Endonuclease exonuclease phosphatase family isoform B [Micractinium conductrix]|eukprot:PSC75334.1 Endonuclease exonuclease phosphatase family isoform B [Micractinium conductrix]